MQCVLRKRILQKPAAPCPGLKARRIPSLLFPNGFSPLQPTPHCGVSITPRAQRRCISRCLTARSRLLRNTAPPSAEEASLTASPACAGKLLSGRGCHAAGFAAYRLALRLRRSRACRRNKKLPSRCVTKFHNQRRTQKTPRGRRTDPHRRTLQHGRSAQVSFLAVALINILSFASDMSRELHKKRFYL